MKLKQIDGTYSVLKYSSETEVPGWVLKGGFFCIARTGEELSIVCDTSIIQGNLEDREDNWKCLKVEGPLDFSLTGILSSIAAPLADAKISIFAISTFDTDYILVKDDKIEEAKTVLREADFDVI